MSDNKIEIAKLEEVKVNLQKSSEDRKKNIEELAWEKIDSLVDQNKSKLSVQIENGMNAKGTLTVFQKEYKDLNS